MESAPDPQNTLDSTLTPERTRLLYRAPGREKHQPIAEILDEILNRLDAIENQLTTLEETN